MTGGYESIYLELVSRLSECDFKESADRLGLEYVNGAIRVCFLMRDYLITSQGVYPVDGRPVNVNNRSVILYYILSKGRGETENSFLPFESLPAAMGGLQAQSRLMNAPLERYFGEDYPKFCEAAKKLGGIEEDSRGGKHQWTFGLFPKIPLKVIFYEADDEFPVSIQIMLDHSALKFLEFECLAFMVGCFVRAMIKTAQSGDVVGWE